MELRHKLVAAAGEHAGADEELAIKRENAHEYDYNKLRYLIQTNWTNTTVRTFIITQVGRL